MIYILRGEGIECENESFRALTKFGYSCKFLDVPKVLKDPEAAISQFQAKDWLLLPGGFSFSDHLGSGRLLAFEMDKLSFLEKLLEKDVSLMGICNGFQVLCCTGLFGKVQLLHNENNGESMNFTDRWVKLESREKSGNKSYSFPVRHGEGRLQVESLAPHTEAFLFYNDEAFTNGSHNKTAGLIRYFYGKDSAQTAKIIGMMPHPEILIQPEAHPDYVPGEKILESQKSSQNFFFELLGNPSNN